MRWSTGAVVGLMAVSVHGGALAQEVDLAIVDVATIDVATGAVTPDRAILVDDGRIVGIRAADDLDGVVASRSLSYPGAFAIPGLMDMHIHLRGGDALEAENEALLAQYLGHGITVVRDAAGDLPEAVARWREEIAAGERVGPTIFTALRKIDGADATWAGSIPVEAEGDIAPALDRLTGDGADFIKIYDSRLDPGLYLATLRAAGARGLRTAAHLPFAVAFDDMLDAGLSSLEHAMYLHKAASPLDGEISAAILEARQGGERSGIGDVFGRLIASEDEAHARAMFRRMAETGTALTPTLYIDRLLRFLDVEPHDDDPGLAEVPPGIRASYARRVEAAMRRSPEAAIRDHARMAATIRLTGMAAEEGVVILAGSDSGASNSHVYAGDSLHRELALLVEAGLSPLAALRAATLDGARWLGADDRFGTLEPGKAADILILAGNPLDDIANTRTALALVRAGVVHDRDRLAALRTLDPAD